MLRYPFNGEVKLTQAFNAKTHLGEDYGLDNRTAIFSVANGTVLKTENDVSKAAGKKQWLANFYSTNQNNSYLSDPYVRRVGGLVVIRALKTEDYGNYIKIDHGTIAQSYIVFVSSFMRSSSHWIFDTREI